MKKIFVLFLSTVMIFTLVSIRPVSLSALEMPSDIETPRNYLSVGKNYYENSTTDKGFLDLNIVQAITSGRATGNLANLRSAAAAGTIVYSDEMTINEFYLANNISPEDYSSAPYGIVNNKGVLLDVKTTVRDKNAKINISGTPYAFYSNSFYSRLTVGALPAANALTKEVFGLYDKSTIHFPDLVGYGESSTVNDYMLTETNSFVIPTRYNTVRDDIYLLMRTSHVAGNFNPRLYFDVKDETGTIIGKKTENSKDYLNLNTSFKITKNGYDNLGFLGRWMISGNLFNKNGLSVTEFKTDLNNALKQIQNQSNAKVVAAGVGGQFQLEHFTRNSQIDSNFSASDNLRMDDSSNWRNVDYFLYSIFPLKGMTSQLNGFEVPTEYLPNINMEGQPNLMLISPNVSKYAIESTRPYFTAFNSSDTTQTIGLSEDNFNTTLGNESFTLKDNGVTKEGNLIGVDFTRVRIKVEQGNNDLGVKTMEELKTLLLNPANFLKEFKLTYLYAAKDADNSIIGKLPSEIADNLGAYAVPFVRKVIVDSSSMQEVHEYYDAVNNTTLTSLNSTDKLTEQFKSGDTATATLGYEVLKPSYSLHSILKRIENFDGSQKIETVISKDDIDATFVGSKRVTYVYRYLKDPEIKYSFVSSTENKLLPDEVLALLPSKTTHTLQTRVLPVEPISKEVSVADGKWVFESYSPTEFIVDQSEQIFVGSWRFIPKTATIVYEFESKTPEEVLPASVLALLPSSSVANYGETISAKIPTETVVDETNGVWTFNSYNQNSVVVDSDEIKFVGAWTYTKKTSNINYSFISLTDGETLPNEVMALLPTSQSANYGETVIASSILTSQITVPDGVWTFKGFDQERKVVSSDSTLFVGSWEFTINTSMVMHEFISGIPMMSLPDEVLTLLPADRQVNYRSIVSPTMPSSLKVSTTNGVWEFMGYDRSEAMVDSETTHFIGTWDFTLHPATVEFEFRSLTQNKVLPQAVKDLLPESISTQFTKNVSIKPLVSERVEVNDGYWTFNGFDRVSVLVDETVEKVIGEWVFTPFPAVVNYSFVSITPNEPLPNEVLGQLPTSINTHYGETVLASDPTQTSIVVNDGEWTFKGYREKSIVIDHSNEEFVGEWEFTLKQTTINYEFVSMIVDKTLPQSVLNLLPSSTTASYRSIVTAVNPSKMSVTVDDGTWNFVKYESQSHIVNQEGLVFKGFWTFTNRPSRISILFESLTDGKSLPTEVMDLLPASYGSEYGQVVTMAPLASTTVEVKDGTWNFVSFTRDNFVVSNDIETVIGQWSFTPRPAQVETRFESTTAGHDLPDEILSLVPGVKQVVYGDTVKAIDPAQTVFEMDNGKWIFEGYESSSIVVSKDVESFIGRWSFTYADAIVTFEFAATSTSGRPISAEVIPYLSSSITAKFNDTIYYPTPSVTRVEVWDGFWNFVAYRDKKGLISEGTGFRNRVRSTDCLNVLSTNCLVVDETKEEVVGLWSFELKPATMNYVFESDDNSKSLPNEVLNLLPKDYVGKYHDVVNYELPISSIVSVADGTWSFNGYGQTSGELVADNTTVTGTWSFTPAPAKLIYEYQSTNGNALPKSVLDTLPAPVDTHYYEVHSVSSVTPLIKDILGEWKFIGFDRTTVTISNPIEKVIGTWEFTPYTSTVSYTFTSDTTDVLPQAVLDVLPQSEQVDYGKIHTPKNPSIINISVDDGIWVFKGYNTSSTFVEKDVIEYSGTWSFEPLTSQISFEFKSDVTLPAAVLEVLPNTLTKQFGDVIDLSVFAFETITTLKGTYQFMGFDNSSLVVSQSEHKIVGLWKYIPANATISYEFISSDQRQELPEQVLNLLPSNQLVSLGETHSVVELINSRVEVDNGVWIFEGFDVSDFEVTKLNHKVMGTWRFISKPNTPSMVNTLPNTGFIDSSASIYAVGLLLIAGYVILTGKRKDNEV